MAQRKNIPTMLTLEGKIVACENVLAGELDTWAHIIIALSVMKTLSDATNAPAMVIPTTLVTSTRAWIQAEKTRLESELSLL